jgi:hypothetical protein
MSKLTPRQKWDNIISARLMALKISKEFNKLRRSSLVSLGRQRRYGGVDYWRNDFTKRATSPSYQEWLTSECRPVADKYGIDEQVVSMLCLIKRFDPEKDFKPFAIEATRAKVYVVTECRDPQVLEKLVNEAYTGLGVPLIQKTSSGEIRYTKIEPSNQNTPPDIIANRINSILTLFRIRIEFPPGYPPDLASALASYAIAIDRRLRERLGYKVPKRLRTSKYTRQAVKYKVTKKKLKRGETYDIVDKIYGNEDDLRKDMSSDKNLRLKANVTRYRIKKNLSDPRIKQ